MLKMKEFEVSREYLTEWVATLESMACENEQSKQHLSPIPTKKIKLEDTIKISENTNTMVPNESKLPDISNLGNNQNCMEAQQIQSMLSGAPQFLKINESQQIQQQQTNTMTSAPFVNYNYMSNTNTNMQPMTPINNNNDNSNISSNVTTVVPTSMSVDKGTDENKEEVPPMIPVEAQIVRTQVIRNALV